MESQASVVTHISDTAMWVAALRARESRRPDAIFHDHLAERLMGERGDRIARELSRPLRNDWAVIVRTKLIDDLVHQALAEGCDRIVNLAAGLDTRPYRLELPASLVWFEADLPDLIAEKERLLDGEEPRCVLRREGVDLVDESAREAFLARALEGCQRALVITEGLLVYLDPARVRTIARDLHRHAEVAWWVIDLASPRILEIIKQGHGRQLEENAPLKFAPDEGVAFFRPLGWQAQDVLSYLRHAAKFRRVPFWMRMLAKLPEAKPDNPGNRPWAAAVRFVRAA